VRRVACGVRDEEMGRWGDGEMGIGRLEEAKS